jgi:hypothetical protein
MEMYKQQVYSNRKEHGKRQENFTQTNVIKKKKKKKGENMTLEHEQQGNTRERPCAFKKTITGTTEVTQMTFVRSVELVDHQQNTDVRKS